MLPVLGDVLPQAIAIAISPVPVALVLLVLVSTGARTAGPAFAAGWVGGVLVVTGITAAVADAGNAATDSGANDSVNFVQLAVGLLFVALAVRTWKGRPQPGETPEPPKLFGLVDGLTVPKGLGLGFVAAAANPKNLPLAISAGATIAQAGLSTGAASGAVICFVLLASSTVLVPVIAVLALGDKAAPTMTSLKEWLVANNATIMIVLFALLGAKMIGTGLALFD